MKNRFSILMFSFFLIIFIGCQQKQKNNTKNEETKSNLPVLKIYTYDSFINYGLGKKTAPLFEEKYNCKVEMEATGDAGKLLNRVIMEKNFPKADIVIGIDNSFLSNALQESLFVSYKPKNLHLINESVIFDKTYNLIPYDYGYFAFVYDSEIVPNPPRSFGEMQDGKWKDKIIMIDPRTSSTGKGMLLWSIAAFGENGYRHFWRAIKGNILTTAASWDDAYNMFLGGEAPIVLSYATSPVYHIENEKTYRYKAVIPEEGGFRQIEGAGIVKGGKNTELAKKYIEFMLTDEFQKEIPLSQYMFPVNKTTNVPESFKQCPQPTKDLTSNVKPNDIKNKSEKWIKKWLKTMTKK